MPFTESWNFVAIIVRMKQILLAALVLCPLACAAQERAADAPVELSREDWHARIKIARERAEVMRRERRSFTSLPPTRDEIAAEATKQVLEDESLVRGDIVSTNRGLFRFEGSPDKDREASDFVRIPETVLSCQAAAVVSSCSRP